MLADVVAVVIFQSPENNGGKNRQAAEHDESLVHAVD